MPCDYRNYPKNWKAIREEIMLRARCQCECSGECGIRHVHNPHRCPELHRHKAIHFNGMVILTIAHLNHKTWDSRRVNLKAMCQRCHNRYDRPHRNETRRLKREVKLGPLLLDVR